MSFFCLAFLPWAVGSGLLSAFLWWLAETITKGNKKDPLNGLAYWPSLVSGAVSVVLFAAFFHYAVGLFMMTMLVVGLVGMVKGWFY